MPKTVPAEYRSNVRKPDDFGAFWDDVLRQASAIPLDAEVVPDPLRTSEDVEVFQVFYTSLEHVRIAGWYCRPARRAGRTPAIMFLPGYQAEPALERREVHARGRPDRRAGLANGTAEISVTDTGVGDRAGGSGGAVRGVPSRSAPRRGRRKER